MRARASRTYGLWSRNLSITWASVQSCANKSAAPRLNRKSHAGARFGTFMNLSSRKKWGRMHTDVCSGSGRNYGRSSSRQMREFRRIVTGCRWRSPDEFTRVDWRNQLDLVRRDEEEKAILLNGLKPIHCPFVI